MSIENVEVGQLVRIVTAPHRKEVEGQHGFVRRIVGTIETGWVFVVAPLSNPDRPVGCTAVDLGDGDIISGLGDLVRIVA